MGKYNDKKLREPTLDDVFAPLRKEGGGEFKGEGGRKMSPFEGPVPGQSLTAKKGNMPYERPPEDTDPEKALVKLFNGLTKQENAHRTLALLEQGIPVKTMVRTLLLGGFMEGKYSAPMLPIMAGPLALMLKSMADEAGIKAQMEPVKVQEKVPEHMMNLVMGADEPEPEQEAPMPGGLMGGGE